MADQITITVDGQEIPAQPGQMIIHGGDGRGAVHPLSLLLSGHEAVWRVPHVRSDRRSAGTGRQYGAPARLARVLHHAGGGRDDSHHRQRPAQRPAARDYGHAHIRASARLPQLPPHRAVRTARPLPAPRRRQRPLRDMPQKRALRAERHGSLSRHGHGHNAHLQQPPSAAGGQRPVLGHGHEPVHRLRALRPRVRRGARGFGAHSADALRQEPNRDFAGDEPARIGLRVLRRLHRRLPHGRPRGARITSGTRRSRRRRPSAPTAPSDAR